MSCSRCSKSHSTVQAFLLTCCECTRKWHHRCHIPPVTDQELVSRIKAHNAGDMTNGLQGWVCKRCTRGGSASVSSTPGPEAMPRLAVNTQGQQNSPMPPLEKKLSREPHGYSLPISTSSASASFTPALRKPVSRPQDLATTRLMSTNKFEDDTIIISDDSNSDTTPDPASKVSKATKSSASSITAATSPSSGNTSRIFKGVKSTSRASKHVHSLAQGEEEESSDSAQKESLAAQQLSQPHPSRPSTSIRADQARKQDAGGDVKVVLPRPPHKKLSSEASMKSRTMSPDLSISREKEEKREDFRRKAVENEKQRRMERRRRQQEFFRAKSEEKEHVELITSHVVDMTLGAGRQIPNHSAAAANDTSTPRPEVAAPTINLPDDPVSPIITSAIQVAEKNLPKEPESYIAPQWSFARKHEDMWDRASKRKASMPTSSTSRHKFKAQKLGDIRPPLYHFHVVQWVDRMKRGPN